MLNKKGISSEELSGFCSQTAMILNSGLQLYDGMETLADAYKDSPNHEMYVLLAQRVEETGSLYEAMEQDERWPSYLKEMVHIGEQAGCLENVMNGLSDYYRREYRIRESIRSAVAYPLMLACMMVVVVLIMLIKVLPVFRRVLNGMGVGVTQTGSRLMTLGSAAGWIVMVIMLLALAIAATALVLMKTGKREMVLDTIRKLFKPYANLERKITSSRFASVLSMMLQSGFPASEALNMTQMVITDKKAAEKIKTMAQEVEEGESFSDSLEKAALFDVMYARMVRMGIAAGREDTVMKQIADIYEERTENEIANLIGVIEPTMVTVLAIIIGAILLSVVMPMAGVLSSIF